jgi:peroxiredoxin Q/BCP
VLAEGTVAPPFTLSDQHGEPVSLADLRGRWVVVWWFPKAFTSGCTLEVQGFRDRFQEFEDAGIVVLGASFDDPADNGKFAAQYGYGGRILSDADRSAGEAYQTARPADDDYPDYAKRRTFVIDPKGVVRKVYAVKDIPTHPAQVLDDIRALRDGSSAGA